MDTAYFNYSDFIDTLPSLYAKEGTVEPLKEEPLKEDPPIKGQCIIHLSTMDKTKYPNFIPHINIIYNAIGTS